jgi:hypothetical protein
MTLARTIPNFKYVFAWTEIAAKQFVTAFFKWPFSQVILKLARSLVVENPVMGPKVALASWSEISFIVEVSNHIEVAETVEEVLDMAGAVESFSIRWWANKKRKNEEKWLITR